MPFFLPLFVAAHSIFLYAPPAIPAGTPLHVRLTSAVGTFASKNHSPVTAILIAPVKVEGETIFPAGSLLRGEVKGIRRVGWGVVHETASMRLDFRSVESPDGEDIALPMRLAAVDNAREEVTPRGSIQRGRSTASLGNRAAAYVRKLAMLDVHAQLVVWALKATIIQIPEPEIYLPTGTELTVTLTSAVRLTPQGEDTDEPRGLSEDERERVEQLVNSIPYRTSLLVKERPSDLVNVVFIGSRQQLTAAFTAAGWSEARPKTAHSDLASAWAVVRNTPYPEAPVSPMLLNDAPADMAWQKGFNDFAKRHHVRLWEQAETLDGEEVWVGAATRDVDYTYFRGGKAMTHQVARMVDHERDKIAADFAFAFCADAVDWVDRPGVPSVSRNATGDKLETDGRVLVVRVNDCRSPRKVGNILDADTLPEHGSTFQRMVRRQIIVLRSDLLRANIYWRSYEGARMLLAAIRHKQVVDPDAPPEQTFARRWYPDGLNTVLSYR